MKKKFLVIAVAAVVAVGAAFNLSQVNENKSGISDFSIESVEALAYEQGPPGTNWKRERVLCASSYDESGRPASYVARDVCAYGLGACFIGDGC